MKCPSITEFDCNDRGTCLSLIRLGVDYGEDSDGDTVGITYTPWEGSRMYGCFCDWGWRGPDCSLKLCPRGADPLVTVSQYFVAVLTTGAGGGTLAGQFRVGVLGHYVYINANADTTTNTVLDTALESLGAIKSVTVTRGTVDVNKGAAYTVTFTAWPQRPEENNIFSHDGTPPLSAFSCAMHQVTSGTNPTCGWAISQSGNLGHALCSNRGPCDFSTGICTCTENYVGAACELISYRYLLHHNNETGKFLSLSHSTYTGDSVVVETKKGATADFKFLKTGSSTEGLTNVVGTGKFHLREGGLVLNSDLTLPADPVADRSNTMNITAGFLKTTYSSSNSYVYYAKNTFGNSYTGNYIDLFSVSPVGADNALHFRSSDGNTSLLTLSSFGDLKLMAVTNSTSTTTGTLTNEGGMSIGKKLYAGTINIKATAAASSKTTGALITKGGLSVAKAMYVGNALALTMSGVVDTVMPYKGVFGDLDFRDTGGFADHDDASGSTQRSSTPICYFNSKIHTAGGVSVTTGSSMTVTQTASSSFTGSLLKLGATVASNANFELINSVTTFASTNWTKEGVGAWYLNNTGTSALMVTGQGKALLGGGLLTAGTAGVELQNGGSVTITAGGINVTSGNIVLGTTGATTITQVGANDGSSDFVWSSTNARVVIENVYFETGQLYGYKSDIKVLTSSTTLASTDNEAHVWLAASGGFQVTLPNCQTSIIGTRFKFFVKTATTTGYVITRAGSSNDEMLGGLVVADETSAHSTTFHTIEDNAISINLINGNTGYGGAPGTEFEAICSADNLWFVTGHVLNGQNSPTGKYLSLGGLQFLVIKDNNDNTIDLNVEFKSGSSTGSGNAISYTGQPVSRATSLRLTATFVEGGVEANIGGGTTTGALSSGVQFTTATNLGISTGANILNVVHSIDGTYTFNLTRPAQVVSAISLKEVHASSYGHSIASWTAEKSMGSFTYAQGTWVYSGGTVTQSCVSLKVTVTWSGTHTVSTTLDSLNKLTLTSGSAKTDSTNLAVAAGSRSIVIDHTNDGRFEIAFAKPTAAKVTGMSIEEVGPTYSDTGINGWTSTKTLLSSVSSGTYFYTATSATTSATSLKITATWSDGSTVSARLNTQTAVSLTSGAASTSANYNFASTGNNYVFVTHPLDGTYQFLILRYAAKISNIELRDEREQNFPLTFSAGTYTYTANAFGSSTSLKVYWAGSGSQTVEARISSGTAITLTKNSYIGHTTHLATASAGNFVLFVKHPQDGTFQITVTKPAHVVSAVSLTDQADNAIAVNFNQGTYAGYTGQGTATGTSLKITVTFASGTTTAFTNSNTAQSLSTATAASDTTNFALNCGSNSLTITHSTDGKITLTITRLCAVSAVALKDHADNTISLSFTAGTLTGYTAVSLPTATSVKLTATFSSGTAQSKTGSNTLQAVTSGSQLVDATNLAIAFGDNTLAIVHSQDGTFSITVNRPGFASEPSISSISHVGFVVTADPANDVNIRCSVYADGAAAPTAAQVNSGVGASSAAVGATNGPVVNVVAAGKTNSGDAHSVTYTGLSGGTNYDVYCATADSTPILSAKADILTTGFTAQPTVANIAPSSFDVTSDPGADVNIRCAVFADGATAPTAAEVNAGTGTGGANYNATNGPITIPPAAGKTNSGDAHTITFNGLSSSTAYDIYCATADSTPVLSNKVDTTTS